MNKRYVKYISAPKNWLEECRKVHGDKYEYDESHKPKFLNSMIRMKCPTHGWTNIMYYRHVLDGGECRFCRGNCLSLEERKRNFIETAKKIYGDRYDYSGMEYVGWESYIKVYDKELCWVLTPTASHFLFQPPRLHHGASDGEEQIRQYLVDHNIKFEFQAEFVSVDPAYDRKVFVDFYLPDKNLIIEYNGAQHYKNIKLFHPTGAQTFEDQLLRDNIVRNICRDCCIGLLEIPYCADVIAMLESRLSM